MPHNSQTNSVIAANVRAEMARARITQTALGTVLNLNQAQISRRLNGSVPFSAPELLSTASLLNVDLSTLAPAALAEEQAS